MELTTATAKSQEEKTEKSYIFTTLIQGFIFLLPLTIILILVSVLFSFVFKIVSPLSALLDHGGPVPDWVINFISLSIMLVFFFLFGVMVKSSTGKGYFTAFEKKYLTKIPLYNLAHQTVYQFAGLKKLPFSQVVLIDPYKSGTLMTGFVTTQIHENLYTIFLPTAPTPMNGNIYHVPKESIQFLTVTPQDAMRTIMGMGTGSECLLQ
jgi:uncharacterized membrane protein